MAIRNGKLLKYAISGVIPKINFYGENQKEQSSTDSFLRGSAPPTSGVRATASRSAKSREVLSKLTICSSVRGVAEMSAIE